MALTVSDMKDKSVRNALRRSLQDDGKLSHEEVIELIRGALDHGKITAHEQNDLFTISIKAKTLQARSRKLLRDFLTQVGTAIGVGPTNFAIPERAGNLVCDFLKRSSPGLFTHLDRDEIGLGLFMRLNTPGLIDQGASSLCGPSSLIFSQATDRPVEYATFGIDLFEKGRGTIGKLAIEPGSDCRNYRPDPSKIHPVDWMMAASIRDSENWFFDYESVADEFAGITLPGSLAKWFEAAGYSDVRNVTNLVFTKERSDLGAVNQLFGMNYRICLFINAQMLNTIGQGFTSSTPNHWVVLRSKIDRSGGNVRFTVFTWGDGNRVVPQTGTLSEGNFLRNFYGYVAAKP